MDAPGSSALAPPGVRRRHFLALMVGIPRFLAPAPPEGLPSTFLSIDGGRTLIFISGTYKGARRRRFLALMVSASGSSTLAPPRVAAIDVFTLMVGTPRSPARAPPGGPPSTFLSVDGGHSRIFSFDTSRGPAVDVCKR
jgi:hypothetical protein